MQSQTSHKKIHMVGANALRQRNKNIAIILMVFAGIVVFHLVVRGSI